MAYSDQELREMFDAAPIETSGGNDDALRAMFERAPVADQASAPLTWQETAAGGLQDILSKATLGAGDEISAGINSILDAPASALRIGIKATNPALSRLFGGDESTDEAALASSYNSRLEQARDLETRYAQENPASAALNNVYALKIPMPGLFSAKKGLATAAKNIGKGAAAGAGYGAAAGFLSGEGEERIAGAKQGAITGGATGAFLSTLGEALQRIGNKLPNRGAAERRRSLGTRESDYTKDSLQTIEIPEEGIATKTRAALDDLIENNELGSSRNPQSLLKNAEVKHDRLSYQIDDLIREFDRTKGEPIYPDWAETDKFLKAGKGGDRTEVFRKRKEDLDSLIRAEGSGTLEYIQQQKIAKGTEWDPHDKLINKFNRRLYNDLQKTVEGAVPEVRPLNEQLAKFKIALPILQRTLGQSENRDLMSRIASGLWTTGRYGVPAMLGYQQAGLPGAITGALFGSGLNSLKEPMMRDVAGRAMIKTGPSAGLFGGAVPRSIPLLAGVAATPWNSLRSNESAREIPPQSNLSPEPQRRRTQGETGLSKRMSYSDSRPNLDPTQAAFDLLRSNSYGDTMQDIDVDSLVKAVIGQESGGRADAISPKGATGLMQIMPATAREIASELGLKTYDLKDAATNRLMGTYYLRKMLDKFGDPELALAAYNAGPGRVQAWVEKYGPSWAAIASNLSKIRAYEETRNYVPQVLARLQGLNDVVEV